MNITAPIMSRFDLFFVVLDECNEAIDRAIATHILDSHLGTRQEETPPPYSPEEVVAFVQFAKRIQPVFSPEGEEEVRACASSVPLTVFFFSFSCVCLLSWCEATTTCGRTTWSAGTKRLTGSPSASWSR